MVNHRVDASHGEFPGEDRGIRGNSPDPTGTESHSERARQLHWKKIYADHPMLTVGVAFVIGRSGHGPALSSLVSPVCWANVIIARRTSSGPRRRERMRRVIRLLFVVGVISASLVSATFAQAATGVGAGGGTPGTSLNFDLVGSNPLFGRGMNAALAIFDHFAYVGSRTDGSNS